jgi:hypothetical protein
MVGILAVVESEAHFVAIGLEMFRANTMPRIDYTALEEREARLDGVGVNVTGRRVRLFPAGSI